MNRRVYWQKYGTLGIFILLVIIMSILSPEYFFTFDNFVQILLQSAITILIALGEFFAILIAGIDLSVGSVLGLTGMVTAYLLSHGVNMFLSILLGGVVLGALIGAINGNLVVFTGLHPFIVTLGGTTIYRGITLMISDARPIYDIPRDFGSIISGDFFGIPTPIIIAVVVAIFLAFITRKTRLGRNIYALGGNEEAAWLSGINTKLLKIIVFIISGVCAGLAGVVMVARMGAAEPLAGSGYETFAIASAIIGGTSFFGGKGKVFGVVIGALIIGLINNSLNILNVQTYYQQILMGALIIGSVTLDKFLGTE
ncbi:D-allose ABC transporter permease [Halanaerobium salsuginis]|jgi:D-allose transport system permease protein|uniref:D-allose transport system permease protein n=1 Tax=Halanaerobium salsuginis TaxID=29563 RepID=A0A1I4I2K8_9FIRM|nr:D-allose ABC transporter permease [Halanaerobium salsuginis]SFL48658.1 D-allose transport system permease protein [Halanaerobium salsuginis]